MAMTNSVGAWPFPAVGESRRAGRDEWFEVSDEFRDEMLSVLPPIYFEGGFMVSEASSHDADGMPVYSAVVKIDDRCFVRDVRRCDAQLEAGRLRDKLSGMRKLAELRAATKPVYNLDGTPYGQQAT